MSGLPRFLMLPGRCRRYSRVSFLQPVQDKYARAHKEEREKRRKEKQKERKRRAKEKKEKKKKRQSKKARFQRCRKRRSDGTADRATHHASNGTLTLPSFRSQAKKGSAGKDDQASVPAMERPCAYPLRHPRLAATPPRPERPERVQQTSPEPDPAQMPVGTLTEYEKERQLRIAHNRQIMAALGVPDAAKAVADAKKPLPRQSPSSSSTSSSASNSSSDSSGESSDSDADSDAAPDNEEARERRDNSAGESKGSGGRARTAATVGVQSRCCSFRARRTAPAQRLRLALSAEASLLLLTRPLRSWNERRRSSWTRRISVRPSRRASSTTSLGRLARTKKPSLE